MYGQTPGSPGALLHRGPSQDRACHSSRHTAQAGREGGLGSWLQHGVPVRRPVVFAEAHGVDVVADLGLVRGGEGLRRLVEVEALIHEIIIVADDTVRPTFKLPLAGNDEGLAPPRTSPTQRPGQTRGSRTYNCGGRYWDRTSDLFGVNEALSR